MGTKSCTFLNVFTYCACSLIYPTIDCFVPRLHNGIAEFTNSICAYNETHEKFINTKIRAYLRSVARLNIWEVILSVIQKYAQWLPPFISIDFHGKLVAISHTELSIFGVSAQTTTWCQIISYTCQ